MPRTISVLLIEEAPENAETIKHKLNNCRFNLRYHHASGSSEPSRIPPPDAFDLVVGRLSAMEKSLQKVLDTGDNGRSPAIFLICDKSQEERAISLMEDGVTDYFREDNLDRLAPAANREIMRLADHKKSNEGKDLARQKTISDRYKSEFLATVSHEIRTGLNATLLLSKLLARNSNNTLSDKESEYADLIFQSNKDLLELVNDVLDLSKIESGKMSIQLEEVALATICRSMNSLYLPLAREKDITFSCRNRMGECSLKTDPIRLKQILKNLLANAFKFTDRGKVTLRIFRPGEGEAEKVNMPADQLIAFEVEDTGIGIPEDEQQQIFESFQQASVHSPSQYGGTGLGLSICRQLTEILGGSLQLRSELGEGSIFTLFLPIDATPAIKSHAEKGTVSFRNNGSDNQDSLTANGQKKGKPSRPSAAPPLEKDLDKSVLLVDDNQTHNLALKEYLGFTIKQCYTASRASDACSFLKNNRVDGVVLDMYLPDGNCYDVIDTIRSLDKHRETPIIIYTGKKLSDQELKSLQEVADDVIFKNVKGYDRLLRSISAKLSDN